MRVLAAALVLTVAGLTAQADLADRARQTIERAGCQTTLPDETGTTAGAGGRRATGDRREPAQPRERRARNRDGLRFSLPFAEPLLWIVVALVVIGAVVAILRSVSGAAPMPAPAAAKATARQRTAAGDPESAPELPDHARLAAAGDFAGAIHALLAAALARLPERAITLPKHATGREALRRARDGKLPTDDLAPLVGTVEHVHFGGAPADAALYADSLARFEGWRRVCQPK